jgi:predicted transcriptional regulator/DNA-binding XRE family transcriptional regulator
MSRTGPLGAKVRALRQRKRLSQVELSRRLGISQSYMNLIEHDQRSLTAPLLLKLAQTLEVDLQEFGAGGADGQLRDDLAEAFADPLFEHEGVATGDLDALCSNSPTVARALLGLYHAFRDARSSADMLASQIYDDQQVPGERLRMPSEDVSDFIQRRMNYFEELEQAATRVAADARFDPQDPQRSLVRYLAERFAVDVRIGREGHRDGVLRRFDAENRRLVLSERMPPSSRTFQLAVQIALMGERATLDRIGAEAELASPPSRALARLVLANYFAGALLMPYGAFLDSARDERYDIELLQHRFGTSFEQVCHRLTTLRRPGANGVAFHLIRVDIAGNISKRFSASGIRFARFSGACPRWNVFTAFLTPGIIRVQLSVMEGGEVFFCLARTVPKGRGGFLAPQTLHAIGLGCRLEHASQLVYADGISLDPEGAVQVGVTCRLCERTDCEQRAFPSIRAGIAVDENIRGPSIYTPAQREPPPRRRGSDGA